MTSYSVRERMPQFIRFSLSFFSIFVLNWLSSLVGGTEEFTSPFWLEIGFLVFVFTSLERTEKWGAIFGLIICDLIAYNFKGELTVFEQSPFQAVMIFGLKILQAYILNQIITNLLLRRKRVRQLMSLAKLYLIFLPGVVSIFIFLNLFVYFGSDFVHYINGIDFYFWLCGKLFGLYLFIPIITVYNQSIPENRNYQLFRMATPLIVVFLFGGIIYNGILNYEIEQSRVEFGRKIDQTKNNLDQAINGSVEDLYLMVEFGRSYGTPDESTFKRISAQIYRKNVGIKAVTWIVPIHDEDRDKFENDIRDQGYSDFSIMDLDEETYSLHRAEAADIYLPIVYIYPYFTNEAALGLNLKTHPTVTAPFETLQTGEMAATKPIRLVQSINQYQGYVLYQSLFKESLISWDDWQPSEESGIVSFVFDMESLFSKGIPQEIRSTVLFSVYDVTDPLNPTFLLSKEDSNTENPEESTSLLSLGLLNFTETLQISFADRKLKMEVVGTSPPIGSIPFAGALSVVGLDLIAIMFLGSYLILIFNRTSTIEEEVTNQTKELLLAKNKAEEATRIKNEFLATTNHELRTPLNGIIATSELLLDSELSPTQRRLGEMIHSSGEILLNLINDVLDFSSLEAGKLTIDQSPFLLSNLLNDWRSIFDVVAEKKGIEFKIKIEGDLDCVLLGDRRRINQVIINLLGNAFKFTDRGKVELFIALKPIEEKMGLIVQVTDTGVGISKEKQKYLFRAFQQGDESTTRRYGGTGLGLAICKRLCEMMEWKIVLSSEFGKGTSMRCEGQLEVPEDAPAASVDKIRTSHAPVNKIPREEREHHQILVVEDNPVNRKVIEIVLHKLGYDAQFAVDGTAALEAIRKSEYDFIFLDCQLPDIQGAEICEQIRSGVYGQWTITVPVIALTANTTRENRDLCMAVGMNDFLSKPIQTNKIKAMIEKWLGNSQSS